MTEEMWYAKTRTRNQEIENKQIWNMKTRNESDDTRDVGAKTRDEIEEKTDYTEEDANKTTTPREEEL